MKRGRRRRVNRVGESERVLQGDRETRRASGSQRREQKLIEG